MEFIKPRPRPRKVYGVTERVDTGCGHLYVTINHDSEGLLCEIFSSLGKAGCCAQAQLEGLCRTISLSLRCNVDPETLYKHIRGIKCPSSVWFDGKQILSCGDAIGFVLEKRFKEYQAGITRDVEKIDVSDSKSK